MMLNQRSSLLLLVLAVSLLLAPVTYAMHASGVPDGNTFEIFQGANIGFSGFLSYGIMNGEGNEVVYDSTFWGGQEKLSQLIWDIENVHIMGGGATLHIPEFFKLRGNFGIWFPVTEGTGSMVDYDWLSSTSSDWSDMSISEADVVGGYLLDINASAEIIPLGPFSLRGILGFKNDVLSWEDFNGSYIYSTGGGFRNSVGTFDPETGIEYTQAFYILYGGAALEANLGALDVNAYLLYSPFVWAEDEDYHIWRDLHFEESFSGGNYVAVGAKATVSLGERLFCSAALHYQTVPEIIGDMLIVESGATYDDSAGIDQSTTIFTISGGFRL